MKSKVARTIVVMACVILPIYAISPYLWPPRSIGLKIFANTILLSGGIVLTWVCSRNIFRQPERIRMFWILTAMGAGLWTLSTATWSWFEVVLRREIPTIYPGDILFFFQAAPWVMSMFLQVHVQPNKTRPMIGYLDASILASWWVFIYFFFITPWQFITPDDMAYSTALSTLLFASNFILAGWAFIYAIRTTGLWHRFYLHYAGATLLRVVSTYFISDAYDKNRYYSGSLYDVPQLAAYVWLMVIAAEFGISELQPEPSTKDETSEGLWPSRLAMLAILVMPILGLWGMFSSHAPPIVRNYRVGTTLAGVLILGLLLFIKQALQDRELLRLLKVSEQSLEERTRLQDHVNRTERLASLGQLVAGAAHEMNNPLTSILGYSELLASDPSANVLARETGTKIGQQARRVRRLVHSLLTFAQQSPLEKAPVNLDSVITQTLQLRQADLTSHKIIVMHQHKDGLPAVLGDANKLMQAMFHIINNAIDAMDETGGGTLQLEARKNNGSVVIEIADTGPGIVDPNRIFDPFYTTKAVGKGAGLGLSATYGIVTEHNGTITAHNRPQGGAVFVITFPAMREPAPAASEDFGKTSAHP